MGGKSAAEKASESIVTREIKPFEFRESEFTRSLKEDQDVAQSRTQQQELTEALAARARGEGESLAERQFRASQDRLLAQQRAAQAGLRGRGGALAGRELARQAAEQQQMGARESATLRAQEQLGAQQQLGAQIQAQRASDIQTALQDRQAQQRLQELQAQQALSTSGLELQRGAQAAQHEEQFGGSFLDTLGSVASGVGAVFSDEDKKEAIKKSTDSGESFLDKIAKVTSPNREKPIKDESFLEGLGRMSRNVARGTGRKVMAPSKPLQVTSPKSGLVAGDRGIQAGLGGGIFDILKSDEDSKINIHVGGDSSKDFLDALTAYNFKYKDQKDGEGEQFGVMAQDLEEAGPVGEQMVIDTPEGKMVDFGKGFGAILAAQVELNDRLKKLEGLKGKKKGEK